MSLGHIHGPKQSNSRDVDYDVRCDFRHVDVCHIDERIHVDSTSVQRPNQSLLSRLGQEANLFPLFII